MRNREAARYARWSAAAAGVIVLAVAAVYAYGAALRAKARRTSRAAVPASVASKTAQFSFSKVEQDRTVFTIRASEATQYKDHDRALLEDVWITIYGQNGKQSDDIHTRQCSYDPQSGGARCEGTVQIDIAGSKMPARRGHEALRLVTRNLTFNQNTGEASTAAPVQFTFSGGSGSGVGVNYSTRTATVRVERSIEFRLDASSQTEGLPVNITGSSLEIHKDSRTAVMNGPVVLRSGGRTLNAGRMVVSFDAGNHPRQLLVQGDPKIQLTVAGSETALSAAQFDALLNPSGTINRVTADGEVRASRKSAGETDRFSAEHANLVMAPAGNSLQAITATGAVVAEAQRGAQADTLHTEALQVAFARAPDSISRGKLASGRPARQRIESAETLAPGTIQMRDAAETTSISARKLTAQAGADGRIRRIMAHGEVNIRRQAPGSAPQMSSAAEMTGTLGPQGTWETATETGGVRIEMEGRQVTANRARIDRTSGSVTLQGAPVVIDGASRTSAHSMAFDQATGAFEASGEVVSVYVASSQKDAASIGAGAAHISSDKLTGSTSAGRATYSGHVRLWQADAVLQADRIDVWRDEQKMQASGNVAALLPQSAGSVIPDFHELDYKRTSSKEPELWQIRAPLLTYWAGQERAYLEGGVEASSGEGTLHSRTLDVYLASKPASVPQSAKSIPAAAAPGGQSSVIGPLLDRVVARGNVIVAQGLRRGTAQQAEYDAKAQKFVLSGGHPTVTDGSGNSVTGGSLTFYVAGDTILIDSKQGSRTLAKHKVEK